METSISSHHRNKRYHFPLATYDSEHFGPLFAVSDEGSAGETIVNAAYASAKAKALWPIDPVSLGVALDGERMTSAGEVPIGPPEYEDLSDAAAGRLLLTTNVGVRVNTRLTQQLPEFAVTEKSANDKQWLDNVLAAFEPFVHTPDGQPRPLTVRLSVEPNVPIKSLKSVVTKLEAGRKKGKIGPAEIHQLSVLVTFEDSITEDEIGVIERIMKLAVDSGIRELAVDGDLREPARRRLGIQSLLNILDPEHLRRLLRLSRQLGVRLTYRYHLDVETAARTIWTGLHTARTNGFSAGKYGLMPMTLEEQGAVIEMITGWTTDWTAIPAFYVDTPLLTAEDVYDDTRCKDAAKLWLKTARGAGAKIVLFDSPDRVNPRRLIRQPNVANDIGVLTFADIEEILAYAKELGISILWSGGITSRQAFELAKRKVFGIFSTSSTAAKIAVTAAFEADPRLPAENEPTDFGVRRIHAIIQGGFLSAAVSNRGKGLAKSIAAASERLLAAEQDQAQSSVELNNLNVELLRGWQLLSEVRTRQNSSIPNRVTVPVPADAVRVFRGKKRVKRSEFIEKLGTVFMPMTVQMQRLFGLKAYLPAILPETKSEGMPDEIALVFYQTQAAYHEAKRCVGGRSYSELHQLLFDMKASKSSFPEMFTGEVQPDKPYHLFPKSVDWQIGSARLYAGTRRSKLKETGFLKRLGQVATDLQKAPGSLDGVIFCATNEWVVWWEHSSERTPEPNTRFDEIAVEVFSPVARRVQVRGNLLRPYSGLTLNTRGDFLNTQFQRV
ncbi:MAG: hypothetical protein DMF07_14685 [Verrucomicrobia bacterium]|nr:MAG: hypothetical protein DMF07_14685 [Verrucomicrobiota bacterium]